jgi:hypothetical protein
LSIFVINALLLIFTTKKTHLGEYAKIQNNLKSRNENPKMVKILTIGTPRCPLVPILSTHHSYPSLTQKREKGSATMK